MNPIQNSAVKERMRLRNDNEANAQIMQIRSAEEREEAQIQSDAQRWEQQVRRQLSEDLKPYQRLKSQCH